MSTFGTYTNTQQQPSTIQQGATIAPASTSAPSSTMNVNISAAEGPQQQQQQSQPQASSSMTTTTPPDDDAGKKKKTTKRRKVNHACLYCRRSHMTCDEGRPCQRCIKREIGHLCHDERRPKVVDKPAVTSAAGVDLARTYAPVPVYQAAPVISPANGGWPIQTYMYPPETFGNEFSVLTDFLETLGEDSFFSASSTVSPALVSAASYGAAVATDTGLSATAATATTPLAQSTNIAAATSAIPATTSLAAATMEMTSTTQDILPAATKTEKFLLTAADQESGSRDERLNRVIRSKYEAGLLKPYNYVKGYARLSRWMDRNVSQESKQQILQPLSVLRPKFRAVAQSLRDLDLVFIEEAFERMLLDYDRVFSAMGVPACLWRRTGEIYKGNREFSELVGVDGYMLRDGRLCIYELMAEESAVNYWEVRP
ncbi:hypothetical protein BJ165DRAFT_1474827 [Panaeolus papilionaceus]|nr:hypothetical protein BJ165DRAFT_1474827 [Panaeolus papilionaceus]